MKLRLYLNLLKHHLQKHRQMAFLSGPRQVGKTTLCRQLAQVYFNYDMTQWAGCL
jgi:predicted AAA+ superfamily ATPase